MIVCGSWCEGACFPVPSAQVLVCGSCSLACPGVPGAPPRAPQRSTGPLAISVRLPTWVTERKNVAGGRKAGRARRRDVETERDPSTAPESIGSRGTGWRGAWGGVEVNRDPWVAPEPPPPPHKAGYPDRVMPPDWLSWQGDANAGDAPGGAGLDGAAPVGSLVPGPPAFLARPAWSPPPAPTPPSLRLTPPSLRVSQRPFWRVLFSGTTRCHPEHQALLSRNSALPCRRSDAVARLPGTERVSPPRYRTVKRHPPSESYQKTPTERAAHLPRARREA